MIAAETDEILGVLGADCYTNIDCGEYACGKVFHNDELIE